MHDNHLHLRRLLTILAGFIVVLFGAAATPAYASNAPQADKDYGKGTLEVCKEVKGYYSGQKFEFVVKKDRDKVDSFKLKRDKCKQLSLRPHKYSVTEKVPNKCKIDEIKIDKKDGYAKDDTAWVEVKKDKKTTVTFVDKCKKHKYDQA